MSCGKCAWYCSSDLWLCGSRQRQRPKWMRVLELAQRSLTLPWITVRRHAIGAITLTTPMPARLTAITVRIGSWTACSWASGRGMAGVGAAAGTAAGAGVAAAGVAAVMAGAAATVGAAVAAPMPERDAGLTAAPIAA